jgi:hypothetical protein
MRASEGLRGELESANASRQEGSAVSWHRAKVRRKINLVASHKARIFPRIDASESMQREHGLARPVKYGDASVEGKSTLPE